MNLLGFTPLHIIHQYIIYLFCTYMYMYIVNCNLFSAFFLNVLGNLYALPIHNTSS